MFRVYVDGTLICTSKADDIALISPVVKLEANKAGSFDFTFPADHPWRESITERKSLIDVYLDGALIFEGVATEISDDFYGQRSVTCEGELTFLNDSILRQQHYSSQTPAQLLTAYIAEHNSQVDSWKQFTVGSVTVTGTASRYTNYETTMKEIGDDLIDDFGGYLRIRHVNGVRYLDYLADSPHTSPQTVALGRNLIDLKSNLSALDICTVLIPLGSKQETQEVSGLDARLTIKSVNSGLDYLENTAAITACGRIVKTHIWDDVTVAANLKTKGQAYLSDLQYANLVIDVTAFDLGLASDALEKFQLLDTVRVVSAPHGLDRNFVITKMTLNLAEPEKDTITLGKEITMKISSRAAQTSEAVASVDGDISAAASSAYNRAVAQATALITSAMGGYVYKTQSELYIMDTNDPETATKVWRWNMGGLGYSSNGIAGPYPLAMTMDGSIVANYINVGTLNANNGVYELNMETGKIKMKDAEITGGSINIDTDSQSNDKIRLAYGDWAHTMSPLQENLTNSARGYSLTSQAGAIFGSTSGTRNFLLGHPSDQDTQFGVWLYNGGNDDVYLGSDVGLSCRTRSVTADNVVTVANSWVIGATFTADKPGYYLLRGWYKNNGNYNLAQFRGGIFVNGNQRIYSGVNDGGNASSWYNGAALESTEFSYLAVGDVVTAQIWGSASAAYTYVSLLAVRIG